MSTLNVATVLHLGSWCLQ